MLKRDLTKAKVCGKNAKRYPRVKPGEACSTYSGMRKEKEEHDCLDSLDMDWISTEIDDKHYFESQECTTCGAKIVWKHRLVEIYEEAPDGTKVRIIKGEQDL